MTTIRKNCPTAAGTLQAMARARMGFTLVELLVCITIIVILAAIGVGVFSSVTARAHSAKCISNLKSLHSVAMLYQIDRPGPFPNYIYEPGVVQANWKQLLIDGGYLGAQDTTSFCPACNTKQAFESSGKAATWFGYGLDIGRFQITNDKTPNGFVYRVASLTDLRFTPEPERAILFVDSVVRDPSAWTYSSDVPQNNPQVTAVYLTGNQYGWAPPPSSQEGCVHLRHNNKANVVFIDGHVEALDAAGLRSVIKKLPPPASPFIYWDKDLKDKIARP